MRRRKKKKNVFPAIIIIVLILIFAGIFAVQQYLKRYSYSKEKVDLDEYFGVQGANDVPITLGIEPIEEHALLLDGFYYMDFASVQKYLNDRFYYGEYDGIFLYTTPEAIITSEVGSKSWHDSEGGASEEPYVISRIEGDQLYVALDYVKKYTNFAYEGFTEPNHLLLTTSWEEQTVASIKKKTQLRLRGGVKSEVLRELEKEETVQVLEELENWSKVITSDAYIGYVENKRLTETSTRNPIPVTDYQEPVYSNLVRDHRINLGFHNLGGAGGNDTLSEYVSGAKSLNVVSPTWFAVSSNDGNIRSYASSAYVQTAHSKGLEVWALLDNFTGGTEVYTEEFINHASSRAAIIENVVREVTAVGADGINLDFESVDAEDGQSYIQFVREMSIACRKAGLVFSIDNYVPMNFNNFYDIEEQGVVADYVIIMGYDEHYAGSAEAGSVASIGYVENGIINTLKDVDASKVINAVPFYTRIWHNDNGKLTSEAVSMKVAKEYIANHGINMTWDAATGQNYGSYASSDGIVHQIWMEDATSLSQKIEVMQAKNIAGIAEWSLGMETSDVWDIIAAYIGG